MRKSFFEGFGCFFLMDSPIRTKHVANLGHMPQGSRSQSRTIRRMSLRYLVFAIADFGGNRSHSDRKARFSLVFLGTSTFGPSHLPSTSKNKMDRKRSQRTIGCCCHLNGAKLELLDLQPHRFHHHARWQYGLFARSKPWNSWRACRFEVIEIHRSRATES